MKKIILVMGLMMLLMTASASAIVIEENISLNDIFQGYLSFSCFNGGNTVGNWVGFQDGVHIGECYEITEIASSCAPAMFNLTYIDSDMEYSNISIFDTESSCEEYLNPPCPTLNSTCTPCSGGWNETSFHDKFHNYNWNTDPLGYGNISNWDVSCITDFGDAFSYVNAFVYVMPDISGWNTSSAISMSSMFSGNTLFNHDIGGWDVSNVVSMNRMFRIARAFNQDISGWDTSNVTSMYNMFYAANDFNQDISGWDVGKVTRMDSMFYQSSFNQNISAWNISSVTNFGSLYLFVSSFSTDNYDALLNGWSKLPSLNTGLYIRFYPQYSVAGLEGRNILTDTWGWTISDGGINCTPNWTQPITCDGLISNYTINYIDSNSCGSVYQLPADNGTIETCCVEDWTQNLGPCVYSHQVISYTDDASCGTIYQLPADNGTNQTCGTSSSSGSRGTDYLVDADGNIVGVSQNGVVQSLETKETPFLSVGGGSGFNIKAWFSNLIADIKGWFVK